jgi:hypothetical protein
MIGRFLDAGHRVGWIAGDEVYGGNSRLRAAWEERGVGYVLAVACSAEVTTGAGKARADALAAKVPKRAWQKLSAGIGAKVRRRPPGFGVRRGVPCPGRLVRHRGGPPPRRPSSAAAQVGPARGGRQGRLAEQDLPFTAGAM